MQVSIETTSGLERRLTIGVPAEKIDSRADERLKEAAKTIRINGFRKGKAPLKVIKQQYGEGVRQEILGDVINASLQEAFAEKEVFPAGQPHVDIKQFQAGKDLEFTATFEVYPEVTLSEFDGYSVEKLTAEIDSSNVDTMIESLREQQAVFNAVERAAQSGDKATINFVGVRDGEEFEGGKADNHELELGSNSMIPGFEDGVVGMSVGDEKVLSLTFPEDYHSDDLKGAKVDFTVTLTALTEKVLPPVDAELIKKFGEDHGDMDKFRTDIEKNMHRELANAVKTKVKTSVMDQLLETHELELPKALVESEVEGLRNQMMQQFGGMQQNKDLDLKSLLPDEMFKERADRRVGLGLLIGEIIKANDIKVDADRVASTIEEMAATYEDPQEVINYYNENAQLKAGLEASVLEDMVVDMILEKATVTEKTVSYEEAVKPLEGQE